MKFYPFGPITIKQEIKSGYCVYIGAMPHAFCLTLWGARWKAYRLARKLRRGLHEEEVQSEN